MTISTGIISTIAGSSTSSGYSGDNGAATSAKLNYPSGVSLDSTGNMYIADRYNHRIRKVTVSTSIITTIAGSSTGSSLSGDGGMATSAALNYPFSVLIDSSSNLYIVDSDNNVIRFVSDSSDSIKTYSGTFSAGDNGKATAALTRAPYGLYVYNDDVYFTELVGSRVRKLASASGIITTVAGNGYNDYAPGTYAATSTSLDAPTCVILDDSGNMFICDTYNDRVRMVEAGTGNIVVYVGNGNSAFNGDNNLATSTSINAPYGLALDSSNNLYVSDYGNSRVRKIARDSTIVTTITGTGNSTYNGDNILSILANTKPFGLAMDSSDNLYIADYANHRVRKASYSTKLITTICGIGSTTYNGDNIPATSAAIYQPTGVSLYADNELYITENSGSRIRKVSLDTGYVVLVAGTGTQGYNGNRLDATSTTFCYPKNAARDSYGNVYITDTENYRVRKIAAPAPTVVPTKVPSIEPTYIPGAPTPRPSSSTPSSAMPSFVPSFYPSDEPTTIPSPEPSEIPSFIPTATPSTVTPSFYPSYEYSTEIYFMANQDLLGISLSEYEADKALNDVIIQSTVVSAIGYDIATHDVVITSVHAVTEEAMTATNTSMIHVKYHIKMTTNVFSDANSAITAYSQSLNESVCTGIFDIYLQSYANYYNASSMTSVKSASLVLSTATPTSTPTSKPTVIPTSAPTSRPTKLDIIEVNVLDAPLTRDVAKKKTSYYLGAYVGYFVGIYILVYLFSFTAYGKQTSSNLYDSAFRSLSYITHSKHTQASSEMSVAADRILSQMYCFNNDVRRLLPSSETNDVDDNADRKVRWSKLVLLDSMMTSSGSEKYTDSFREYMLQKRTLIGCDAIFYPAGVTFTIPCTKQQIVLPPGRLENIVTYIMHNHLFFSSFYFIEGSKLGAHGTRILYIGKEICVFVLYQFSRALLGYYELDGYGLGILINIFIVTPSAGAVARMLRYMYVCPFTETEEFKKKYADYKSIILLLGRIAILPIVMFMGAALITACFLSSGRQIPLILIQYFVFVQLYGIVVECVQAYLLFVDTCYYRLSLFGVDLCIGKRYLELIVTEQQVDGVDFACTYRQFLCGIKYMRILNREDAMKAGMITVPVTTSIDDMYRNSTCNDNECDIEMNKITDRSSSVKVTVLPPSLSKKSSLRSKDGQLESSEKEESVDSEVKETPKKESSMRNKDENPSEKEGVNFKTAVLNATSEDHDVSYGNIYQGNNNKVIAGSPDTIATIFNPLAKRSTLK